MTYLIGDKSISLNDSTLTAAEEDLIRAHPEVFSTLISKIPHYEDLRLLTTKSRVGLTRLEADFNTVFGSEVDVPSDGWEQKNYETMVKKMALVVLQSCADTFDLVAHTDGAETGGGSRVFFPPSHHRQPDRHVARVYSSVVKQLAKIDTITRGIERESKLLDMVFGSVNPSLKQYTAILLGKAILKRHIPENDCRLIHRREVCFQAEARGEHPTHRHANFEAVHASVHQAYFLLLSGDSCGDHCRSLQTI
ncbi:hypothetical protein JCM33374_g3377 [Metschnikowia sp. JCM 33374]|nr:hypothetical protein JCM33374_g3377 [Metschnikowia sp. JCM 33374]